MELHECTQIHQMHIEPIPFLTSSVGEEVGFFIDSKMGLDVGGRSVGTYTVFSGKCDVVSLSSQIRSLSLFHFFVD